MLIIKKLEIVYLPNFVTSDNFLRSLQRALFIVVTRARQIFKALNMILFKMDSFVHWILFIFYTQKFRNCNIKNKYSPLFFFSFILLWRKNNNFHRRHVSMITLFNIISPLYPLFWSLKTARALVAFPGSSKSRHRFTDAKIAKSSFLNVLVLLSASET